MGRLDAHRTWLLYQGAVALALATGWTVAAVYFVREVGMGPFELVLAGTTLEVAYFLFEVPTAVVADVYSRRLSVIVGQLIMGAGSSPPALSSCSSSRSHSSAACGARLWTASGGAHPACPGRDPGRGHARVRLRRELRRRGGGDLGDRGRPLALQPGLRHVAERQHRRLERSATVISITNLGDSAGQWGGGPAHGAIGSLVSIRAALAAGALVLTPALALYGRAIRLDRTEP